MTDAPEPGRYVRDLGARLQEGLPLPEAKEALAPTWSDPEWFERELFEAINLEGPSIASRPGFGARLYQDLVGRHLGRNAVALVYRDPVEGWRELTYEALHETSAKLAATWTALGVEAGEPVALVMPVGGPLALCLVTALRLGLFAHFLPPLGRRFVQARLQAVGEPRVVLADGYAAWLGLDPERRLPAQPAAGAVAQLGLPPHGYEPTEPALAVFPCLGPPSVDPVSRGSQALLFRLAVDAKLVLGLRPTDRVAAPDFAVWSHQPALLLSTLFAGAAWIQTNARALEDEALAAQLRPTVVGVTPALRDRVLAGEARTKGWRRWFKDPAAPYEWASWHRFGPFVADRGAWGQNLLTSAAYGGSLLFCPPRPEPQLELLASPGMPWSLAESTLGEVESSGDSGILTSEEADAPAAAVGRFTLGDSGPALFFAGSVDDGRSGTTFPADEVAEAASAHPAVDAASVVVNRGVRTMNGARIVLLAFVDPAADPSGAEGKLRDELQDLLRTEMGEEHLPDRVEIYPLYPPLDETGAIDQAWCRWQYLTGELAAKAKDELFRLASLARRRTQQAIDEGDEGDAPDEEAA